MTAVSARSKAALLVVAPTLIGVAIGACSSTSTDHPLLGSGGSTTSGSTTGGGGSTCVAATVECHTDADCDDGDPSTTDSCNISDPGGEFPSGTCLHVACDSGLSCTTAAVDPACSFADAGVVYPAFVPLVAPDVPSSCANGFEIADAKGAPNYTIVATPSAGSRALTLDLDFATYEAPDGLLITGVDPSCKEYVLFSSCRMKTADLDQANYTDGMHRPTDAAIRQFHLKLRPGTRSLTFDFSRIPTAMYFQVLGLCDFALPAAPGVGWYALVP